jgi:alpha-glucosidase
VIDLPPVVRQDPAFHRAAGQDGYRDGCRVPIPWSGTASPYGNGTGTPWLPQPDNWGSLTVAAQRDDAESTLAFYRRALAARRDLSGDTAELVDLGEDVLAFRRGDVLVALNAGEDHVPLPDGELLLASSAVDDGTLPPDCAVWLRG